METVIETVNQYLVELLTKNDFIRTIPDDYCRITNLYHLKKVYTELITAHQDFLKNLEWHKEFYNNFFKNK